MISTKRFAWSLLCCSLLSTAQTRPSDPLAQARQLYNDQKYDDAIRLSGQARTIPAMANAATLVFARAHLERYRVTSDREGISAARDALKQVNATTLTARDRVELMIAFGECLYLDDESNFDDRYSAAAEQFELALGHAEVLDPRSRDLLFEWWALSLDHQAQQGPESERRLVYERMVARAESELARSEVALSASYWLAAGARGVDDLPRAAGAAVAGWVRAASFGPRGVTLREDLDRLMVQVILPERARGLSAGADPRPALTFLAEQWEAVKGKWR